jgi:hypothetical protein
LEGVWTLEATTGPRYRDGTAMAYDAARKVVVLFGGHYVDDGHKYLNDTWTWDGVVWRQMATTSPPSARANHTMAYDASRQRVVLFGGSYFAGSTHYLGDTWEWNGSSWTQVSTTGPSARSGHAMVYNGQRARVMLFGGANESVQQMNDTWEWNGTAWSQQTGAGPSARVKAAMTYDNLRQRMVLFGGERYDSGQAKWVRLGDTWLWDSVGKWKVVIPSVSPSARAHAAMAFDGYRAAAVLFGGLDSNGQALAETWEWNGTIWAQVAATGPYARTGAAMTHDSRRRRTVMFGPGSDTWEYHEPPYTLAEVAEAMRIYGGLTNPTFERYRRLNMEWDAGGTLQDVDFMDILKMARKVSGLEDNP